MRAESIDPTTSIHTNAARPVRVVRLFAATFIGAAALTTLLSWCATLRANAVSHRTATALAATSTTASVAPAPSAPPRLPDVNAPPSDTAPINSPRQLWSTAPFLAIDDDIVAERPTLLAVAAPRPDAPGDARPATSKPSLGGRSATAKRESGAPAPRTSAQKVAVPKRPATAPNGTRPSSTRTKSASSKDAANRTASAAGTNATVERRRGADAEAGDDPSATRTFSMRMAESPFDVLAIEPDTANTQGPRAQIAPKGGTAQWYAIGQSPAPQWHLLRVDRSAVHLLTPGGNIVRIMLADGSGPLPTPPLSTAPR